MVQQYQVLARKYRPKNFHELIGQDHVSQALINAIDYERLHHAYLFTGTRGVGKTTIARILSKCLNCDTGVTSTPCGVCENCVAIDEGRFIDLIEIDAASRTKVEDTRELLDNVPYAPTQGRYKVYLIDEVHMLSTHSFNALLKTLEEPPAHVKFLLATTDPQKLPITIISRCLQFVLRPLPQALLSEHLADILTKENVAYSESALWQLANAAKGSVRDALSLTDQAIAFGQGALSDDTVNSMLGLINTADLVHLLANIYDNDRSAVAAQIQQMRLQMVDASSMFDGLAELLHQMALVQLLPDVALGLNERQEQLINELAQRLSPETLQLYYEIVIQAREGIRLANTPMQSLEMCLLRLLAFRPLHDDELVVHSSAPIEADVERSKSADQSLASNTKVQQAAASSQSDASASVDFTADVDTDFAADQVNEAAASYAGVNVEPSESIEHGGSAHSDSYYYEAESLKQSTGDVESIHSDNDTPQVNSELTHIASGNVDHIDSNVYADTNDKVIEDIEISKDISSNEGALSAKDSNVETSRANIPSMPKQESLGAANGDAILVNNTELQSDTLSHQDDLALSDSQLVAQNAEQNVKHSVNHGVEQNAKQSIIDSNFNSNLDKDSPAPLTSDNNELSHIAEQSVISKPQPSPQTESLVDDPRSLLKCPPQPLSGQWSVDKWDYWLQTAREQKQLDQDELALARQGLMTGECDGEATFVTAINSPHLQATFTHLVSKIQQQFPNAKVELQVNQSSDSPVMVNTPELRQKQRLEEATTAATNKLMQSPVMQYLSSRGQGRMGKVKIVDIK